MRKKRMERLSQVVNTALGILYPYTCPFCGKVMDRGYDAHACPECLRKLPYITEPRCKRCGKPLIRENQEYCRDCENSDHQFDRGFALWTHKSQVKTALYQFKYHNRRIYSHFLAKELAGCCGAAVRKWGVQLIIPIPISKKRKRKRGYNQAGLLAKEVGKLLEIPVDEKSFIRLYDTVPQKMLGAKRRKENLRGVFKWVGSEAPPERVLLIDDIYTTGNTMDSAALALKRSGARKVFFLVISIGQGN